MEYAEIKNILLSLSDPVEKLETVMDFGKHLAPIPESAACTEISGCSSLVRLCNQQTQFYGWADSALVRGVVAIIISMVNGKTFQDIKEMDLASEFASLQINLGAGRMNGINSMIRFFKNL
jgi:cysteine desulfuration protein SufE